MSNCRDAELDANSSLEPQASGLEPGPDETLDELLRGRLRVLQPRRGYRLSVDPLLLADFVLAHGPRVGRFCDLGAGVGVIGLALAAADPRATGTLVELQPRLAALAARNVALAGAAARLTVLAADLRRLRGRLPADACDLVVANPPYRPAGSGRPNPDPEKAIANVELECRLADLAAAARRILKPRGRFGLVHDAARLVDLLAALGAAGLGVELLRFVHPRADAPAARALVLARRLLKQPPLRVAAPLVLHQADGAFTPEAARMLGEGG